MDGATMRRVTVDPDLCIGSGECVRIDPGAFAIDEDLGVSLPQPEAAIAPLDRLVRAAQNCPTNAIAVRDSDGSFVVRSAG